MTIAAHAATVIDSTPARAIIIGKAGNISRVTVTAQIVTMKECREALPENPPALQSLP